MSCVSRSVAILALVATATAVSQAFGRFTYSVLLTDIRDELGLSNTLAGTFGSTNLAAYLLASLLVSIFIGRLGLSRLAASSVACVTLGLGLLAWSPTAVFVAVALALTGFGAAGVWIAAPALATAQLGDNRRGAAVGVAISGVGLGMVIASGLDTYLSWRDVYLVEAAVGLVVTVIFIGLGKRGLRTPGHSPGFGAIRQIPGWQLLVTAYGAFGLSMSIVITFLVALLEDDAGFSAARASFAFSLLGLGSVFGGPLTGYLADKAGRRVALVVAFFLMAASTVLIANGDGTWAIFGACAFGAAFTGVPVAVTVVVSDHARGEAFGSAYAVATIVFGAGLTAGPQVGGFLADTFGSFRPAFGVAVGVALVGMAASAWVSGARSRGI